MDCIIQGLQPSKDGFIRSIVDGAIWKQKVAMFQGKFIIPLNVYLDDFNTSDTASHHSRPSSICGVYYNIPCLPSHLLSKLNNIQTAGYVKSSDKKVFGNDRVFSKLVEVLSDLETNGLEINYKGEVCQVYFVLGFILGDNLGLNSISGFVECFRANFFCRLCKRTRLQTENDCVEHSSEIRCASNYEVDLLLNDVSSTGIKTACIFNQIPSFHITDNFVCDIMHDVLEGVLLYALQHCLHYFIFVK